MTKTYKVSFYYTDKDKRLRSKIIEVSASSGNAAIEKIKEQFGEHVHVTSCYRIEG